MHSFKETALRIIKENPEVFEALLEFERTKKVPKISYRKRIDITLDENVLRKFRKYCKDHGMNMSRVIEKHVLEELGTHKEKVLKESSST